MPKREKARILAAMQQSTQNRGHQRTLATELDDQPRLLASVLRAHMETCEFTREKVTSMRQRARDCPAYSMPTLVSNGLNFFFFVKMFYLCKFVKQIYATFQYIYIHRWALFSVVYAGLLCATFKTYS